MHFLGLRGTFRCVCIMCADGWRSSAGQIFFWGSARNRLLSIHQGVAFKAVFIKSSMGWLTKPSAGCSSLAC